MVSTSVKDQIDQQYLELFNESFRQSEGLKKIYTQTISNI